MHSEVFDDPPTVVEADLVHGAGLVSFFPMAFGCRMRELQGLLFGGCFYALTGESEQNFPATSLAGRAYVVEEAP